MSWATLPIVLAAPPFQPRELSQPHAGLALSIGFRYRLLGIALTLVDEHGWHAVAVGPNVILFELEHGLDLARAKYNGDMLGEASRTGRAAIGTHAGFSDLFVPVLEGGKPRQMLVAGPFLQRPSSSADIVSRWRALSGKAAHLSDAAFSRYVAATLSTVVLDAEQLGALVRLVEHTAAVVAGRGVADDLRREIERADQSLWRATLCARIWDAARAMLDPSTPHTWLSPNQVDQRAALGLRNGPEHALVGLLSSRLEVSAVEQRVLADGIQRACTLAAHDLGRMVCAPIANHGIAFLLDQPGPAARARARFAEIEQRATAIAKRAGFRLHFGACSSSQAGPLSARYEAALGAAEEALSRGVRLVEASGSTRRSPQALAERRRDLSQAALEQPTKLAARFERYLDVVGPQTGYQLEPVRLHLETGLESLLAPFVERGLLDSRNLAMLLERKDRALRAALTVSDLYAVYRRAVAELESALTRPAHSRRENDLTQALAYIHDHLAEPFRREDVARAGGFAPDYFSRLFALREGMTFGEYVQRQRVERAKQLLVRSELGIQAVGKLCGFASGPYFHRVFRRFAGVTPAAHRKDTARYRARAP